MTPFLGFLWDSKKLILIVSGALLMIIGYSLRRTAFLRSIEKENGEMVSEEFAETVHNENGGTEDLILEANKA